MAPRKDKSPQDLQQKLALAQKRITELEAQLKKQQEGPAEEANNQELLQNLLALINSTEDHIWMVDKDMQLLFANETSRSIGTKTNQRKKTGEITSPDFIDDWDTLYQSALQGENFRLEGNTGKDNRVHSVTVQSVKIDGEIIGASVFSHDITEQHRLQVELARFEQIISSTPDMVSLVDRSLVYQVVNDAYLNNYKKLREELIGKTVREVVGSENFERISKPNLKRAFAGETVCVEDWLELPEMGRRYMAVTYHPVSDNTHSPAYVAIAVRDITSLKLAEADRQRIFDVSLDMLCVTDFDGYHKELNPACSRTLGWSEEELKSRQVFEFVIPDDQDATIAANQRLLKGESLVGFENRLQCKDGAIKWISWNSFPDLEKRQIFSVARDVTERRNMEEELRRLATTDNLTGAYNRRQFIEQASVELKRSRRYGSPLAVLMLDVDHFKKVNDTYGHDAGDEALKRLVDCCLRTLRSSDVFGRFGGEEFAAVLPETDEDAALLTCKRLAEELAQTNIRTARGEINITASIGLTMLTGTDQTIDSLIKRADDALYEAKNSGRNQIVQH